MKRIIGATVAGVIAFSGVYALAASLSVTSDQLGAGVTTVAACQSATLNATYVPSYQAGLPGYSAGTVTLNGLASTCYGVPYRVELTGSGSAPLGEATGTTPSSGSTLVVTLTTVNAASVTGVAVVLGG